MSDSTRFYFQAIGAGTDRGMVCVVDPARVLGLVTDSASLVDRRSEGPPWAVRSPDKQWDAFIWNHEIYIRPARDYFVRNLLGATPPADYQMIQP